MPPKPSDAPGHGSNRRGQPRAIRRLVIWYRRNAAVTSLVGTATATANAAGSMAGSVAGIPNSGVIQVGELRIDTNKRQVYRGEERVRLTGMEFSLLELLVGRSGEPFSRGEILKEVWGYTPERHVDTRVVDVHISRLRSKLEDDPANPELILTARGTGYLFQRIVDAVAPEAL